MMTVGVQLLLVTVAVGSSPAVISALASGLLHLSHPTSAARNSTSRLCKTTWFEPARLRGIC